ncbi:alpha/beta-hydrolase, partial [Amylocystis lapponica]
MSERARFLTSADGTRIWAESAGDTSKRAVVFIHGLSSTASAFEPQFTDPEMQSELHLVRYEMRGHGRSDRPQQAEAYDSIRQAEDFRTVCEAFDLERPFVLAWGLGACISVDIVTHYGVSYISGIIYIGGPVLSLALGRSCYSPFIRQIAQQMLSPDPEIVAQGTKSYVDSCVADPASLPNETKLQWIDGFTEQSPNIRRIVLTRQQDDTFWREQARDLPVLVVQGVLDMLCLYETMLDQVGQVYAKVELELMEDVGHSPHLERPAETNRCILNFVAKAAPIQMVVTISMHTTDEDPD